ncbi:MAG: LuxR C-terminal-related transcriptional regulator [Vicinamibacterales bacterium]|nr:LuxR C-terminal-related transcriptional regulator [Vicinamibacterales bacterium]
MEARELFALFDHAGDAAFAVGPQGLICYWSSSAESLLGLARNEALSRNCEDVLRGEDGASRRVCTHDCQVLQSARKNRDVPNYDLYAMMASGERKWLNISIILARVTHGASPLVVHLMRDISARKRDENLTREIMLCVGELTGQQADQMLTRTRSKLPVVALTPQELVILRSLSLGHSTKEMAAELRISTVTVRNHIQHILGKLKCHTRLEAVLSAARQCLV